MDERRGTLRKSPIKVSERRPTGGGFWFGGGFGYLTRVQVPAEPVGIKVPNPPQELYQWSDLLRFSLYFPFPFSAIRYGAFLVEGCQGYRGAFLPRDHIFVPNPTHIGTKRPTHNLNFLYLSGYFTFLRTPFYGDYATSCLDFLNHEVVIAGTDLRSGTRCPLDDGDPLTKEVGSLGVGWLGCTVRVGYPDADRSASGTV